jgi:hypothetical protein
MEIPKRWWNNEPIESVKKDYDDRLDHMIIFQRCPYNRPARYCRRCHVRYCAAAPSIAVKKAGPIMWDAVNMKVIGNNTRCCGVNIQ